MRASDTEQIALGHLARGWSVMIAEPRGDGGVIVVPPSIHPSGKAYRWVEGHGPDDLERLRCQNGCSRSLSGTALRRAADPGRSRRTANGAA